MPAGLVFAPESSFRSFPELLVTIARIWSPIGHEDSISFPFHHLVYGHPAQPASFSIS